MVAFARDPFRRRAEPRWWSEFEPLVPPIQCFVRRTFADVHPERRERIVADVTTYAFFLFQSLAERGKADIAYPRPLAITAMKHLQQAQRRTATTRKPSPRRRF